MQHIKRWITALILAPLILWILIEGSLTAIAILVSAVAVLSIREYLRIIFGTTEEPVSNTIKIISYVISILLIMGASLRLWEILFLVFALNLMALSIFVLSRFAEDQTVFNSISKQVLGIVYIPVPLSLLIFIRQLEGGTFWIIWLLIVIFANDTGAFYTGTFFGKRALAPKISPKKTIEGSLGGITVSILAGFIFCLIFFHDLSLSFLTIPGSFMLAVSGQIGDLFESAMKRASGIKDSGRILPGHGGILDRIDGLLPAIPVLYAYLVFVL
ncbi:MAG: CDP-diglyceride synthetase [Desulfobacterales bacterium RIFOXYA12_FULL_46_15]|nr:MAG: CDP-diglyceride synthetase [Desulfobacterales bacterium RIFOXYA12_FULL_46_15]